MNDVKCWISRVGCILNDVEYLELGMAVIFSSKNFSENSENQLIKFCILINSNSRDAIAYVLYHAVMLMVYHTF